MGRLSSTIDGTAHPGKLTFLSGEIRPDSLYSPYPHLDRGTHMADATLSKLLHLVTDGESTEIRRSALKVLGSVGAKDGKLVKTLLETLNDPEEPLRIAAIEALGELQIDDALKPLEEFVRKGGVELESAVHAASLL